jgi:hypothetical protein
MKFSIFLGQERTVFIPRISTLGMSSRIARSSLFLNLKLFASCRLMLSLLKVDLIRMELPLIKPLLIAGLYSPVIHQFWRHSNHQKVSKFIVLNKERIRYDTRTIRTHADLKKHITGATSDRKFENRWLLLVLFEFRVPL